MIKLIVFDLDGVLVDSCDLHYNAFNSALEECGCSDMIISYDEHIKNYNGKPTYEKLSLLSKEKGLSQDRFQDIWKAKQKVTQGLITKYEVDERIAQILKQLKEDGYEVYCASNSIWKTLKTILLRKGYIEYIDYFISSDNVKRPKPHPEIYYRCLQMANVAPDEALIIEDSDVGYASAKASGANVLRVSNSCNVTYENIVEKIKNCKPRVNIVIPMAGLGTRFVQAGYKLPKPMIDVMGKPMIQWVVDNLRVKNEIVKYIFITRKEHFKEYNLSYFLQSIAPGCQIVTVDETTEGAACTVLLAKKYINNTDNLIIANSDQFLEWNCGDFLQKARNSLVDGMISTFESSQSKWSYAKEDNGYVCEVAEKRVISNKATTGVYYWKHGRDFVQSAETMIKKNVRVNNEFYVCPVYNEAILENKKITTHNCEAMWGLGTPEDLNNFLDNYKPK